MPSDPLPSEPTELTVVTMRFEARDVERLGAVLARYVVLARRAAGCRNIDLCASATRPGRFLVIEKWTSAAAQRAHLDADVTVELARACEGLLAEPPDIDLLDAISAYDLE